MEENQQRPARKPLESQENIRGNRGVVRGWAFYCHNSPHAPAGPPAGAPDGVSTSCRPALARAQHLLSIFIYSLCLPTVLFLLYRFLPIFTDFYRFSGLSWETSTFKNYHPEDSKTSTLEKDNLNLEINLNDGGVLSGLDVLREYQYW